METWRAMEQRLTPEDRERLGAIYAPVVVGVPPEDARRSLCVMPDGELRVYGHELGREFPQRGRRIFTASRDGGLSWKTHYAADDALGPAVRSPWTGRYVTIDSREGGTYAFLSEKGPDDTAATIRRVSAHGYQDMFQPLPLHSRRRWVVPMHRVEGGHYIPTVMLSDDDGESWRIVELVSTPRHEAVYPHTRQRWQNDGAEPHVVECRDGTLLLLARTSLDVFYLYRSVDGGDTWTPGEPSRFHGTLTTPYLLRLSDGRILFFWNNTQPLPEGPHRYERMPSPEAVAGGWTEDVFTNRDVNHVAVSADDGATWTGFRELWLNDIRNHADFRAFGGAGDSADKSIHQFQAIELPLGKVLVVFGQQHVCRRMAIFDPAWLYETGRREDFQEGLAHISTHVYVKSYSGSCLWGPGTAGHCAWNRQNGALLVPNPTPGDFHEVLQLCRIADDRLVSPVQGAVWNFPAAQAGRLHIRLRVDGAGVRISLADRWFNPIDTTIRDYAAFSFVVDGDVLPMGEWVRLGAVWDLSAGRMEVRCDDRLLFTVPQRQAAENGISYLHLQSTAEQADPLGSYIGEMTMTADAGEDKGR